MPLVLAPSGSGKSHLVRSVSSNSVLDGDEIISEAGLWPPGKRWWTRMSYSELRPWYGRWWRALIPHIRSSFILFNANPDLLGSWRVDAVWLPADRELLRNAELRIREAQRQNQEPLQPILVSDLRVNREKLRKFAKHRHLPILDTAQAYSAARTFDQTGELVV